MSTPQSRPVAPILALVAAILAVSTAAIFIRFAQAYASSLVIAAYRLALAVILLSPIALIRHRKELRTLKGRDLGLALLSGLFLALHFAAWISSLEYTSVASSVVLVTTTPLWVALLTPFTLKEPLGRKTLYGMGLALLGGVVIGLSDSCSWTGGRIVCPPAAEFIRGQAFLGDLLALSGAIMAAAYLLIGRRVRANLSLVPYIFVVYGMSAVALVLAVVLAGEPLTGYPPPAYVWLALLALVPQLFGHSTFNWALRYVSAAFVSITLLGEPVGSTILAYFLLDEAPAVTKIFGAILILTGIVIAARSEAPAS